MSKCQIVGNLMHWLKCKYKILRACENLEVSMYKVKVMIALSARICVKLQNHMNRLVPLPKHMLFSYCNGDSAHF